MTGGARDRYFDALETRDPARREADLMAGLARRIAHLKAAAPGYARILEGVDPETVSDRAALARLPVTRKAELAALQAQDPPFGGLAALAPGHAARLFASPGPIYEPEAARPDFWRMARALHAAGFRAGELVHNSFSYHLTPGGWIMDAGARALGCAVIPAGVGDSEQQVAAIAHYRPDGYTGTPDFLKVLLDKAGELGRDAGSLRKALVSGGALFNSLREAFSERRVAVLQCYASADLGLIAYETRGPDEGPDGAPLEGMVVEEALIVEIVRPGTGDPLPSGEVGEVVVTNLESDYPLLRFATGDLSAVLPGVSPCGRTNTRIKGWMGRADQTVKVKGMFVHPSQIAEVLERHPEVAKARLEVAREGEADAMRLLCEAARPSSELERAIARDLQAVCKVRGRVDFVALAELPNDGKVIADLRSYD